jgi:hypothetical protein
MTKNYIIIKTNHQNTLKRVLMDLANLYHDTSYAQGIQLYREKKQPSSFLVQFTNEPDLDRFSYFTNYFEYPIDITDFKAEVTGYYQTKHITDVPDLKTGEWLLLWVNPNDKHGDNVYIVTEDHNNYIYDFGGYLKALEQRLRDFKRQPIAINNYHHILNIFPAKPTKHLKPEKIGFRNKLEDVLVIIVCLMFTVLGLWFYDESSKSVAIATIAFFGFGFVFLLWKFLFPKAYDRIKNRNKK